MNVHKNARLTPFGRERLVKQVLERVLTPAAASAAAGVSLRTIYKWLARFKNEGSAGLCDRGSRPKRLRCALSARQRQAIERLPRERRPYREIAEGVRAPQAGVNGSLYVFDPANGNVIDNDVVGFMPTAVAISPDGARVFVTNKDGDNVNVYDSGSVVSNITVGDQPTGIAFAPSGGQVFVTNSGDDTISIISASSFVVTNFAAPQRPIAINSRGSTAYVAQLSPAGVREIGGLRFVTVVLSGNGIGNVRSSDSRINCGTACQAEFPQGDVTLTASAGGGSNFGGWSGGCSGLSTTATFNLSANTTCIAVFNASTPPPSQQNRPQSGCFIATAAYGSDMAYEVHGARCLARRCGRGCAGFRKQTVMATPAR